MKKGNKKEADEESQQGVNEESFSTIKDQNSVTEKEEMDQEVDGTSIESMNEKKDLMNKICDLNDKYLRVYSDFDNYRKRTIKEKNELCKFANSELIIELLPVIDDFERALKSIQKNDETEPIIKGIELVYSKFVKILELQGLKPIKSIGEDFNTDFHEAITKIPTEDENMKGKVFDEIQKGYELNEKIIRYAQVIVAE